MEQEGERRLFDVSYQSDMTVVGNGNKKTVKKSDAEVWLYQVVCKYLIFKLCN